MLLNVFDPPVSAMEGPAVGNVIHPVSLGLGPEGGSELAMAQSALELQLDPPAV